MMVYPEKTYKFQASKSYLFECDLPKSFDQPTTDFYLDQIKEWSYLKRP